MRVALYCFVLISGACWSGGTARREPVAKTEQTPRVPPESKSRSIWLDVSSPRAERARKLETELGGAGTWWRSSLQRLVRERGALWLVDHHHPHGALVDFRTALSAALHANHLLRDPTRGPITCQIAAGFECQQLAGNVATVPIVTLQVCFDERLAAVTIDNGRFAVPPAPPLCP